MCRNIKTLFKLDPPRHSRRCPGCSLQFVRNISFSKSSKINEQQFLVAAGEITEISTRLLRSLEPMQRRKLVTAKSNSSYQATKITLSCRDLVMGFKLSFSWISYN